MRIQLKRSLALFMAGVLVASSINVSAFAEETVSESETLQLEETVQETAEDAELTETAAKTPESVETAAETSESVETAAETPEPAETTGETAEVVETEVELESVNNTEAEAYTVLTLDEMVTITEADIPEDGMVHFRFTPEAAGRYCIEVSGDQEYYLMNVETLNHSWEAEKKWIGYAENGVLCECTVAAGNSKSFNIVVTKLKDIETVEMVREPYKKTYMTKSIGTFGIDDRGMEVRVVYSDGTEEILQDNNRMLADGDCLNLEPFDIDWSAPAPGNYTMVFSIADHKVSYEMVIMSEEDYRATQGVLPVAGTSNLDLQYGNNEFRFTPENEGSYTFGFNWNEWVDSGILQWADLYCDGSGVQCSLSENGLTAILEAGKEYILTLCVSEAVQFPISISASGAVVPVKNIEIAELPYKQTFIVGQYLDYEGMKVNVTLEDGTVITVSPYEFFSETDIRSVGIDESGVEFFVPGTYKVRVYCEGAEVYYDVQVMDKETYMARLPELSEDKEIQADTGSKVLEFRFSPKKSGTYMFRASDDDHNMAVGYITGGGYQSAYADRGLELTAGETYLYSVNYGGYGASLNVKAMYVPKISEYVITQEPNITNYRACAEGESGNLYLYGLKAHVVYDDGSEEDIVWDDVSRYGCELYVGSDEINWNIPGDYSVEIVLEHGGNSYTGSFMIHVLGEEDYLQTVTKVKENLVNTVPVSSHAADETKFEFSFTPSVTGYYIISAREYDGSSMYDLSVLAGDAVLQSVSGERFGAQLTGEVTYIFSAGRTFYAGTDDIDVLITKQEQKPIKELILNKKPDQLTYKVDSEGIGGSVNTTGLSVDVVFEDGTRETVEDHVSLQDGRSGTADFSAIDWNTPGIYTYRITLEGLEISFDIEVQTVADYVKALPELSEKPVDFSLNPNVKYGWFYEPHAQHCVFTPSESGYYMLSVSFKDGEWLNQAQGILTDVTFTNPDTGTKLNPAGIYTEGIDKRTYGIYLQKGKTCMFSLSTSDAVECSVDIQKMMDVKSVKIISSPDQTEFSRDVSGYEDVYMAAGLRCEIEYADGTKEILKKGDLSKEGMGLLINYSYDDFEVGKTTVTVEYGGTSDTYEIRFLSKADYLAKVPAWESAGQKFALKQEEKHIYRIDIKEEGLYEFDVNIDSGIAAKLYDAEFSFVTEISNHQNKSYVSLGQGTCYLTLENSSLQEQAGSIQFRKFKNIKGIEIVNKDELIEQMPWIEGISSVNDYKNRAEIQLLYEDGTTEVLDSTEGLKWSDYLRNRDVYIVRAALEGFAAEIALPIVKLSDQDGAKNINVNENVIVEPTEGRTGSIYTFTVPETKEYYISYNRAAKSTAYYMFEAFYVTDKNGNWIRERGVYDYSDIVNTLKSGETYYVYIPNSQAGGNLRIASEKIVIQKDDSQQIYYTGTPQKLDFEVTLAGKTLTEGKDYSTAYMNNVEVGDAYVIIKPINENVFPEYHAYFRISQKSLRAEGISIEPVGDQRYTGEKITPEVVIKDGTKVLEAGKDYYVEYSNNINTGTARMIICGIGNYSGKTMKRFEIVEKTAVSEVVLNKTAVTFTGKSDTVALKATVKPENATDKSVTWSSSNAKVAKVDSSGVVTPVANGTAVITVKTKDGNKTATCKVTVKFPTVATLTNLRAVTSGPSKAKLTWNAVSGAEGYLVYAQKNGKYGYVGMTTKGTTYTDTKALTDDYNFYWVFPYVKDAKGNMYTGGCQSYKYAKGGVCPAVINLRAASEVGQVRLTWKASVGAEGYLVYGKTATGKYGYIGMTTRGTTYVHKKASKTEYNFYWVFPYHKDANGKMIVGGTPKYVYGKAK